MKMNKKAEAGMIGVEQKIEDIIARQLSLQHELKRAKRQLEAVYEQEHESSLRSLHPGDPVHIFYMSDIPKRAQQKIGQSSKEAVVVAHGEKCCLVSVRGVELNIRYCSLLVPGAVIPAARVMSTCREIEATLQRQGRQ